MATVAYAPYVEYGAGGYVARPQDHLGPGGDYRRGDTIRVPVRDDRDVWYRWNQTNDYYPTTTSTYTTTSVPYDRWVAGTWATTTGTTTNVYNPQVWVRWVAQVDEFTEAMQQAGQAARRAADELGPRTAEQIEALRVQTAEARERMAVAQQEQRDRAQARRERESALRLAEQERVAGAQERALVLFESLLTKEERRDWKRNRKSKVTVRGENGTLFEIGTVGSVHGNVVEVDEHGCRLGAVCVAPSMLDKATNLHLPLADGWIGQLLSIRHNLADFRTRGNWSYRHECRQGEAPRTVGAPDPALAQMMREDGLEYMAA